MSLPRYRVVRDPEYGYLRADPLPNAEEVAEFYLKEFYGSTPPEKNDSALASQDETFNNTRFSFIRERAKEQLGALEGRRLLDIGCGFCQALLYFKELGLDVRGVDPARDAVQYGIEKGLSVRQGGVEDEAVLAEGGPYDLVLLLNVLEHLREPANLLRALHDKIIAKDGLLVIDVPNEYNAFQEAANEEYGLKEWWFSPPAHLNYFSPSTLGALLTRCGYEVVGMESSFPMEMFLLMGDNYVGNSELGRACHAKRIRFEETLVRRGRFEDLRRFYEAMAQCGLGRQIVVYARPVGKASR